MNTVEFLFALLAVFGSTGLWFFWLRFIYQLEDKSNENVETIENQEEFINLK
jgi:hypothetical protein